MKKGLPPPCTHELLQLNTQRIRNAIDIVEVANDLTRVMNGRIGESCCTQCIHFLLTHCRRICGQLLRIFAQRLIRGGKVRNTPIPGNSIYVGIRLRIRCELVDLSTEVMGVAA